MRRVRALVNSLVGQKVLMAVSGIVLLLFVIGHLFGNLKVFQGPEHFNAYAEGLRAVGAPFFGRGQLLWIARLGLLATVTVHVWSALLVTRASWSARPADYRALRLAHTTVAARTMRWGGVLLGVYVVYHLLDLTFGRVNPGFIPGDAYGNLVLSFQRWPVVAGYSAAMVLLGLHLYHGLWSAFQTLGLHAVPTERLRRAFAAACAVLVVTGYLSIPLAVFAGLVR